jgi:hypothetical protein
VQLKAVLEQVAQGGWQVMHSEPLAKRENG